MEKLGVRQDWEAGKWGKPLYRPPQPRGWAELHYILGECEPYQFDGVCSGVWG